MTEARKAEEEWVQSFPVTVEPPPVPRLPLAGLDSSVLPEEALSPIVLSPTSSEGEVEVGSRAFAGTQRAMSPVMTHETDGETVVVGFRSSRQFTEEETAELAMEEEEEQVNLHSRLLSTVEERPEEEAVLELVSSPAAGAVPTEEPEPNSPESRERAVSAAVQRMRDERRDLRDHYDSIAAELELGPDSKPPRKVQLAQEREMRRGAYASIERELFAMESFEEVPRSQLTASREAPPLASSPSAAPPLLPSHALDMEKERNTQRARYAEMAAEMGLWETAEETEAVAVAAQQQQQENEEEEEEPAVPPLPPLPPPRGPMHVPELPAPRDRRGTQTHVEGPRLEDEHEERPMPKATPPPERVAPPPPPTRSASESAAEARLVEEKDVATMTAEEVRFVLPRAAADLQSRARIAALQKRVDALAGTVTPVSCAGKASTLDSPALSFLGGSALRAQGVLSPRLNIPILPPVLRAMQPDAAGALQLSTEPLARARAMGRYPVASVFELNRALLQCVLDLGGHEGWLWKRRPFNKIVRGWNKRYFKMKGASLQYFPRPPEPDEEPKGLIDLSAFQSPECVPFEGHPGEEVIRFLEEKAVDVPPSSLWRFNSRELVRFHTFSSASPAPTTPKGQRRDVKAKMETLDLRADRQEDTLAWFAAIALRLSLVNYIRTREQEGGAACGQILECVTGNRVELVVDQGAPDAVHSGLVAFKGTLSAMCLRRVAIRHVGLTDGGARLVAQVLSANTALTSLDLQGNQLGVAAARHLTEALHCNRSLVTLCLNRNCLLDDGVMELSKALGHPTLRSLDLSANRVGDQGAAALSEQLRRKHARVRGQEPAFPHFPAVNLACNQVGDEGCIALACALATNPHVHRLFLNDNRIGPRGIRALCGVLVLRSCGVVELDVSGNRIGEEGVSALAQLLRARRGRELTLDISRNNLQADALAVLASSGNVHVPVLKLYCGRT